MAVEIFSCLHERMCRTWGSNSGPLARIRPHFSKGFYKVNHLKLLLKLTNYGIKGNTLNWIKLFLIGRSQTVILDGEFSNEVLAVADPEGVREVQTNPLLSLNYFIFMGNFRKEIGQTAQIESPSDNLSRRSKSPGSAPVSSLLGYPGDLYWASSYFFCT